MKIFKYNQNINTSKPILKVNNMNINKNISIVYDTETLNTIKIMIKEGFDKLNSFFSVKSSKFKVYFELKEKFNEIADKLRNIKSFSNEFAYFRFIKRKILHIIYQNCEDKNYGHYDFALELFDFFMEIWDARIKLNKEFSQKELELYETRQISFKRRCHKYRREFYLNIYHPDGEYNEKEIYNIHKTLME